MSIPVSIFLIPYSLFILIYIFFVVANIYHLKKYGINVPATRLIMGIYLGGTAAIFLVSFVLLVQFDWNAVIEVNTVLQGSPSLDSPTTGV